MQYDKNKDYWRVDSKAKELVRQALLFPPANALMRQIVGRMQMTERISRLPVSVDEVHVAVLDGEIVLTDPRNCSIAKELYWGKGRRVRNDERNAFESFHALAKDADVVFDIGANTGIFALAAARANPRARVHAFEIVPHVFHRLLENVVRNDLLDRVECHLKGVGTSGFCMTVPSRPWTSMLPSSVSSLDHFDRGVRVGYASLDELATRHVSPGERLLVKIDVEGTEDAIFAHGMEALRAHRPDILCEILGDSRAVPVIGKAFEGLGYRLYKVCPEGLERRSTIVPDNDHYDWVFTTRPPPAVPGMRILES